MSTELTERAILASKRHDMNIAMERWRILKTAMTERGVYGPWLLASESDFQQKQEHYRRLYSNPNEHHIRYVLDKARDCRAAFASTSVWNPYSLTGNDAKDILLFEKQFDAIIDYTLELDTQWFELQMQSAQ